MGSGIRPNGLVDIGRGEMIRTSDPLHPMQVRYQAALRPDRRTRVYRKPTRIAGADHSKNRCYCPLSRFRIAMSSERTMGLKPAGLAEGLANAWAGDAGAAT